MKIFLSSARASFSRYFAVFVLNGLSLTSSVVAQIPDINSDLSFRTIVENALDHQLDAFRFDSGDLQQHYYVSYGKGYLMTHAVRLNSSQKIFDSGLKVFLAGLASSDFRKIEDASKEENGSVFRSFLAKTVFFEDEEASTDFQRKYEVYLPKSEFRNKPVRDLRKIDLQGPYFTFTLALFSKNSNQIDQKFLDSDGKIQFPYRLAIVRLLTTIWDEKVRKCPELVRVNNAIEWALFEKNNTPNLTQTEGEEIDRFAMNLKMTRQLLINTQILPEMNQQKCIEYVQRIYPDFPDRLILGVVNEFKMSY